MINQHTMDKGYPLILVFYLDSEMMRNKDIILPFTESVNHAIAKREANMMAFFMPTDGEERIECINPIYIEDKNELEKLNKLVGNLEDQFQLDVESKVV